MTCVWRALAAGLWVAAASLADTPAPLMPWPASAQFQSGAVAVKPGFSVFVSGAGARDPRVTGAIDRLFASLARQTGLPLPPLRAASAEGAALRVVVEEADHRGPQQVGDDERYSLEVSESGIRLSADRPLGVLRGMETFLQLVRQNPAGASPGFSVPYAQIRDEPRFSWRGLSLDVSRHFIPADGIERTIDGMAAVKLNVLHWHLSDDQGFRVESKKYPRLQQLGSEGLYYTQAEIRDIVAYARDRGVRVVPEFDMPGHASSWLAAYPSLGAGEGPFHIVSGGSEASGIIDPAKTSTYRFLDTFVGEMARLFPDAYFHIGGDEVNPRDWNRDPHIRAFMKKQRLENARQLQAYFNGRLEKILAKYKKKMVGWDEILEPGLPKSVVIQSWRGPKSLAEAARQGHPGILSAGYYLDLMQPASQHYAIDPLKGDTANLDAEKQRLILGGEAAMWEELATAENLDAKLWPRLAAIAERFWSPESVSDPGSMYTRLEATSRWLEWSGLTQRSSLERMRMRLAGSQPVEPLDIFAEVLEPVKGYERHRDGWSTTTAFNRLVDAIPPESEAAREFNDVVDRYLAAPSADLSNNVRARLARWLEDVASVRPLLEANSLLAEAQPVAAGLATLCRTGIEALSYRSAAAPADWKTKALAAAKDASAHRANLMIAIAPAIQKLVDSTP